MEVPREIIEKLEIFQKLVTKWNKSINLVSDNTIHNFLATSYIRLITINTIY